MLLIVHEMFAFIIEYFFYIQVGKNKIEVLTGDEQKCMSHGPVQIVLTNQDNFSDEASSLWEVIRETSDTTEKCYLFVIY